MVGAMRHTYHMILKSRSAPQKGETPMSEPERDLGLLVEVELSRNQYFSSVPIPVTFHGTQHHTKATQYLHVYMYI